MKIPKFHISKHWPLIVLLVVELSIAVSTLSWNTWLVGWDNTMPEIALDLSLKRVLTAPWQEYRGLGMPDAMAHAANLIHWVYIKLISLFVPVHLVRQVFLLSMHALGVVGMYVLARWLLPRKTQYQQGLALLAAIFYGLNPATIQMFYQPLELFIIHYGFLPWLLAGLYWYLDRPSTKRLAGLFTLNLAAVSQAHVPTIFIVYMLAVGAVMTSQLANFKKSIRYFITAIAVILLANAFWLGPYLASLGSSAAAVTASKINRTTNTEISLRNDAYGNLDTVAGLKGFGLSFEDWDGGEGTMLQMPQWDALWSTPISQTFFWITFTLALTGTVLIILRRDHRWLPAALIMLLGLTSLGSQISGLSLLISWARDHINLFAQIFRFAFTKFSLLYALGYTLTLTYGLLLLTNKASRYIRPIIITMMLLGISYTSHPILQGNLWYQPLKQDIPNEYTKLFTASKDWSGRAIYLPLDSFWGWEQHQWGHRGSGFIWQGMAVPLVHRSFDAWSPYNETIYNQLARIDEACPIPESGQLYPACVQDIRALFVQYGIRYVIVDEALRVWPSSKAERTKQQLEELQASTIFHQGSLTVYQLPEAEDSFVTAPPDFTHVDTDTTYTRQDVVYEAFGDYVSLDTSQKSTVTSQEQATSYQLPVAHQQPIIYPYAGVYREEPTGLTITQSGFGGHDLTLTATDLPQLPDYAIRIPGMAPDFEYRTSAELGFDGKRITVHFDAGFGLTNDGVPVTNVPTLKDITIPLEDIHTAITVSLGGAQQQLVVGEVITLRGITLRVGRPFDINVFAATGSTTLDIPQEFISAPLTQCWTRPGQAGNIAESTLGETRTVSATDASGCLSLKLVNQAPEPALLTVAVPYRSEDGQAKPHFCIVEEGVVPYQCLHDSIFDRSVASSDWASISQQVVIDPGANYWLDISARPGDAVGQARTISYRAPTVTTYQRLTTVTEPSTVWTQLMRPNQIRLPQSPRELVLNMAIDPAVTVLSTDAPKNCDVFERGSVGKENGSYRLTDAGDQEASSMTLTAKDQAAVCDSIPLSNLSTHREYLLRLRGENLSGRSLKAYVYNAATDRNDLEVLASTGQFDHTYALMSWPNSEQSTYALNLQGQSFGKESSVNRLDSVDAYPVSLGWLARIHLSPQDTSMSQPSTNSIQAEPLGKWGTSHYLASIHPRGGVAPAAHPGGDSDYPDSDLRLSTSGLIKLSQGYDTGWLAYAFDHHPSTLEAFIPWVTGTKLDSHVKVNGWSNGWLLDSRHPELDSGSDSKTQYAVILFWPQYLEWLGLILLLITLLYLGLSASKKTKVRTKSR